MKHRFKACFSILLTLCVLLTALPTGWTDVSANATYEQVTNLNLAAGANFSPSEWTITGLRDKKIGPKDNYFRIDPDNPEQGFIEESPITAIYDRNWTAIDNFTVRVQRWWNNKDFYQAIIFSYQDKNNYYAVYSRPAGISVVRKSGSNEEVLGSLTLSGNNHGNVLLAITCSTAGVVTVTVDGNPITITPATSPLTSGKVGFQFGADGMFQNFSISGMAEVLTPDVPVAPPINYDFVSAFSQNFNTVSELQKSNWSMPEVANPGGDPPKQGNISWENGELSSYDSGGIYRQAELIVNDLFTLQNNTAYRYKTSFRKYAGSVSGNGAGVVFNYKNGTDYSVVRFSYGGNVYIDRVSGIGSIWTPIHAAGPARLEGISGEVTVNVEVIYQPYFDIGKNEYMGGWITVKAKVGDNEVQTLFDRVYSEFFSGGGKIGVRGEWARPFYQYAEVSYDRSVTEQLPKPADWDGIMVNAGDSLCVRPLGRAFPSGTGLGLNWSMSGAEFNVINAKEVWIQGSGGKYVGVSIDDGAYECVPVAYTNGKMRVALFDGQGGNPQPGSHKVRIVQVNENQISGSAITLSKIQVLGVVGGADPDISASKPKPRRIEVIGDCITAGFGVNDQSSNGLNSDNNDATLSYATLLARKFDADISMVAMSNAGLLKGAWGNPAGDATEQRNDNMTKLPELYKYKITNHQFLVSNEWDFSRFAPDLVIINAGANDAVSTGTPMAGLKDAYKAFVVQIRDHYKDTSKSIPILLSIGPRDYGGAFMAELQSAVDELNTAGDTNVYAYRCVINPDNPYNPATPNASYIGGEGASSRPSAQQHVGIAEGYKRKIIANILPEWAYPHEDYLKAKTPAFTADNNGTLTVPYEIITEETEGCIILALYQGNKLIMQSNNPADFGIKYEKTTGSTTLTGTNALNSGTYNVKLFAWDNVDAMTPLVTVDKINVIKP